MPPQPGDVGFATIAGGIGGLVNLGQALILDACRFTHVFWVVNAVGDPEYPEGRVVEAMPGGARYGPLRPRLSPGHAFAALVLSDAQRAAVPRIAARFTSARGGKGIGYSFLSYPAIAATQLFGRPGPLLKRWVGKRDEDGWPIHLICSQLVDEGLRAIGFHVFADGRAPADVTPGDVFYALDPRVIVPIPE